MLHGRRCALTKVPIPQSVYTAHRLETATSQPQLGLLSTVNIEKAMNDFWVERGYDNNTIGVKLVEKLEVKPASKDGLVYGTSVAVGFAIGFIGTVASLWCRSRRSQKTNSVRLGGAGRY